MTKGKLIALCGVLTALAAALSALERILPPLQVAMPGFKLGLAGIVTMVALVRLGRIPALSILLCRCAIGALFGGGVTGFWFSLSGGLVSLGVMMLLLPRKGLSLWGVSMAGAAAHNTGQILAAMALLSSTAPLGYLPYLLLLSVPTGLLTAALTTAVLLILPE